VLEVLDVLDIEIVDPQVHAHVVAVDGGHYAVSLISSSFPRRRESRGDRTIAPGPPPARG
jgi:hypothetical protein